MVYVKNMVCNRCIMVVTTIFEKNGISLASATLGEVVTTEAIGSRQMIAIENDLEAVGFEILGDKKKRLAEKIKTIIITQIRSEEHDRQFRFSDILASALRMEYSSISKLFSELENITIERYIIEQKIEMVKELLVYGQLNLNEIAFKAGYSSAAHLSAQFKKITGFSPIKFRKLKDHHRRSIDTI